MRIAIGSDHRGVDLKLFIIKTFKDVTFIDMGAHSKERVDYPDYACPVAEKISLGECERGILICGSGIGMSIVANKFKGVRAALVGNQKTAELTRLHNDSNVLCLAGDFTTEAVANEIVHTWLKTDFEGGRHKVRLIKIEELEGKNFKSS